MPQNFTKHHSRIFSAPIPGQSMALHPPGGTPWQQPPKYTTINDACNYIFNTLTTPTKLKQILEMFKQGVPLEVIARVVIFSGFSQGLWTPDLGMMLSRPVVYMLAAMAQRAGHNPKLTGADRSGLKELVGMQKVFMTNQPSSLSKPKSVEPPPQGNKLRGLMSPPIGMGA